VTALFRHRRLTAVGLCILACLLGGAAQAQYYWFESYQKAVELIDKGRLDEASALLEEVVQDHPVPNGRLRIPGGQFIAYLPYYHQARISFQQGRFENASHYLDVSEAFGEVAGNREAERSVETMRTGIADALRSTAVATTH
jgi:hypothetical protein